MACVYWAKYCLAENQVLSSLLVCTAVGGLTTSSHASDWFSCQPLWTAYRFDRFYVLFYFILIAHFEYKMKMLVLIKDNKYSTSVFLLETVFDKESLIFVSSLLCLCADHRTLKIHWDCSFLSRSYLVSRNRDAMRWLVNHTFPPTGAVL